MTTSSSAGQCCGRTGEGCASRMGGPPKLCLVTPGAASRPSASFSLVRPMVCSSSVLDGCCIFHQDTYRSEHSHTIFSKLLAAFTENTACCSFRQLFIFTMEKLLFIQLSIQTHSAPTVLQCINQHVGHSFGHSYLLCNNCWSFSRAFSHTLELTHNIEVIMCIVCNQLSVASIILS